MRFFLSVLICSVFLSHFELENVTLTENSEINNNTKDFSKLAKSQTSESVVKGVQIVEK